MSLEAEEQEMEVRTVPLSGPYLYELVQRVPKISDKQVAKMRHIHPLFKGSNGMYRKMIGVDKLDPRSVSFLFEQNPIGEEFTFDTLNSVEVITQHNSGVFFKPSLAEVYAWIMFYLGDNWNRVRFFHMGESFGAGRSTDVICKCMLLGGPMMVKGKEIRFANDSIGHEMVKREV